MKGRKMVTFCEYMKQSLGRSGSGYYSARARIGFEGGDFFTAPETSSAFASLLALQIMGLDRALGSPDPFYMIEAGPGNGTLAFSLLTIFRAADPGLFDRLSPLFYEIPGILRERQEKRISTFSLRHPPRWINPVGMEGDVDEQIAPGEGVVFGNEFMDALPVHRIRGGVSGWEECYVDMTGREFREVWGPLSSEELVLEVRENLGENSADRLGHEFEICLALPEVLGHLDRFLARGFMLWIDYGDIAEELYSERRKKGTLLAYRNHRVSENLLGDLQGESDLTAFVDFSRVFRSLSRLGYRLEGYTDQMSWLMGLGFPEWLEANADRLTPEETVQAGILLHPLKMGRIFKVLLMGKGVGSPELSGFRFGGLRPPP